MKMYKLGLLLALATTSLAQAAPNQLYLPNLSANATGTQTGPKFGLDVNVISGALTFTEQATAADGAAPPALFKVIAGVGDNGLVQMIHTDNIGNPGFRLTDGTNYQALPNITGAQFTSATPGYSASTAATILGWDGSTHREVAVDTAGKLALSFADQTSTGSITSTQSVTLTSAGLSSAAVLITGTWTGTLTIEGSVDGVVFYPTTGAVFSGGLVSSNFSSNNSLQVNVSAFTAIRVRGNTVTSGTADVFIRANSTAGPVVLTESLPQGGNVIGLVGQSGTWSVTESGFTKANAPTRLSYTGTPVTTGAYVQLVASTTSATREIEIFDSSGQTLVLATGAAAAEVDQINIFPGGNGRIKLAIPAATRVSIKAVSATANTGEIDINWYQ